MERWRSWLTGRRLVVAWQLAVTLVLVALASTVIDFGEVRDALATVDPWWVPPALLGFTAGKFVDSWRWRYLLRAVARRAEVVPPQRLLFATFLIGNGVNNVFPFRLGDVAKMQVLHSRLGMPRSAVAASLFVVEASLDGIIFALLVLGVVLFLGLGALPDVPGGAIGGLLAVVAVAVTAALLLARRGERLRPLLRLLPARWHEPLRRQATRAAEGLDALRTPRRLLGAIALSVPAWLIEGGVFYLMGQAFGLDHAYPTYVAAMVAANLAVALPVTLWNFGTYEALVAAVLVAAGTSESVAVAYALAVHVLTSAWIVVTALLAFWALRLHPSELLTLGRDHERDREREAVPEQEP